MTISIWRSAHLVLAIVSALFLLAAAGTGIVLAWDAVQEKTQPFKVAEFEKIKLSESLPELRRKYPELLQLTIDHNQFVTAEGFDEEGNDFKSIIHPVSGEVLGEPAPKSDFIQWNLALHRSLFMHETGRFIVGVVSFLLMLIVVSGTVLIIQRQQGIRHFFDKMTRDFFAQYYHVVVGRLLLIPIFILAATGTCLFLIRFEIIQPVVKKEAAPRIHLEAAKVELEKFPVFQQTLLSEVVKIEFPLDEDPSEYFKLQLKDREITVQQHTGELVEEYRYPLVQTLDRLSLDLHTGRTSAVWAIVLGIASLNILFFIYSGFLISYRRLGVKTRNKFKPEEAEYILLTGSENGSTLRFAQQIHQQLLANGIKSYQTELNRYQLFPKAKQLVVFSSTFGLGDAPTNARLFEKKLAAIPQQQPIQYSVVGFGSHTYKEFCGYAVRLDELLAQQKWATKALDLHTVNDKSTEDFVHWVKNWSQLNQLALVTSPAMYGGTPPGLKTVRVTAKTAVSDTDRNFQVQLEAGSRAAFRSGDLLAIYPAGDERERLYSIAKIGRRLQLVVKLHEPGLGSQYLYNLKPGDKISARIIQNPSFHFPGKAPKIAMIANGTGIAPFLGMMEENKEKRALHLYAGFRYQNNSAKTYEEFVALQQAKGRLEAAHFAYSRAAVSSYVMDLIRKDAAFFAELFNSKGVVLICGSLAMQQDVEAVLDQICRESCCHSLSWYKTNGQLLTDCY
jgi:sulfite reductase (NADPH) flavoprotein alpha-component